MCNKELPEDIILQIFSRLPAKSVGRCRCLSKRWRFLLSQPNFIKTHLDLINPCTKQGLLLDSRSSDTMFSASLSSAHQVFDEITISASSVHFPDLLCPWKWISNCCNGLLLIRDFDDNLFVINPTTREIGKLPDWPSAFESRHYYEDPNYGFGYDYITNDYKVIVIHTLTNRQYEDISGSDVTKPFENTSVYVYSLRNGTWKTFKARPLPAYLTGGVFVNGQIHWLACCRDYRSSIMAFDLANEVFRVFRMPQDASFDCFSMSSKLAESLGALEIRFGVNGCWAMMKYGDDKSWTNFSLKFERPAIELLCALREEEIVTSIDEQLYLVYLKKSIQKEIVVRGIEGDYHVVATYAETLVSPNYITATQ